MTTEPTSPEPPPSTSTPSRKDLDILKGRVRKRLQELEMSQRALEKTIGLAGGQVTKVFKGERPFKHQSLLDFATTLQVPPEALVEGTAFEALLHTAPETPALAETLRLREELDWHRVALVAREAEARQLQEELARIGPAHDRLRGERQQLDADLRAARQYAQNLEQALAAERAARALAEQAQRELRANLRSVEATLQKVSAQANEWRECALQQQAHATQLQEAYEQIRTRKASGSGDAIFGGLLGLALGVGLSGNSSRRR
jgi:transcriptional regulator with XRE-family HTH domain